MFSYHIFQNNYTAIITEYILYLRKFNDSLGYSVNVREYVLTKENTRDRIATCESWYNFEALKINKKTEVKVQILTSVFF